MDFSQVDKIIESGITDLAPAVVLTVYRHGKRLINRAYGYLDSSDHPTTTDTLFDLASITKLYTTTAFLMQVAEGKVSLKTPVANVLPEFASGGVRPIGPMQDPHTLQIEPIPDDLLDHPAIDPNTITFYHLLTHTSGLAPWRDLFLHVGPTPPPPGQPDSVSCETRTAKALELISAYPFVDVPGRTVRYSDLGLILLGAAVARLEGEILLNPVMDNLILRPAKLTRTGFNPVNPAECAPTEFDARWRERRCRGEVHDENACGLGGVAGHAGLFATGDDVARFGTLWLDALAGRGWMPMELARDATAEHAVTGVERRGLGWMLRTPGYSSSGQYFSPTSIGHTGFTGTSLWIDPHRELVVALLTNRVYYRRDNFAEITAFRIAVHDAIIEAIE